ncbi:hypothetical protein [Nitratireductor sp. GCM10026969]|uniref:hypothetical protein n=1 Tax=Nitratireductor sp. GCM10026969 TaxID=3252645 RepID=UPI00360D72B1
MTVFTKPAVDVFAPTDAAGVPRSVVNGETQVWGTEVERAIQAAISAGALVYGTKAELDADLDHDDGTGAWVVADPDPANNGIYRKVGASGTGSWQWLSGIPTGPKGWSPLLRIITDGARRVLEVYDWTGGEGVKPTATGYIGASGLTPNIADAIDIRGPEGPSGPGTGDMLRANNLSDVDSVTESQRNIAYAAAFATEIVADGAIDAVASLVALEAEAEEVIRLKNATYYIGTDYTPSKTLRFSSGTKFLIADGVTVDFSQNEPEIHAPKKQRFDFDGTGTGAVVGLDVAHLGWFAGEKMNTSNSAIPEAQKWADSVVDRGILKFTLGYLPTDGSAYIVCSKGQNVIGKGRKTSKLRFLGTDTRGFQFTTVDRPTLKNVGAERVNDLIAPTAGKFIDIEAGIHGWEIESIYTSGCYDGVSSLAGNGKMRSLDLLDTRNAAIHFESSADNYVSQGIIAATSSWMTLTGVSGTFQNGETITWSGGTATVFTDGTNYKAIFTEATPANGTVITGSTSGASGTVDSVIHSHAGGGIRLLEQCEAHLFTDVDVVGGQDALLTDATVYSVGARPLTCVFVNCLFDSAKNVGANINKSVGTKFIGCWFSNRPADQDVYIAQSDSTIFEACQWTNSWNRAMLCEGTAKNTQILGGFVSDYNRSNTAGQQAFLFAANSTGIMRGTRVGLNHGYGGNPQIGVQIESGADWELDGVDVSNCPTPIVDNSGGSAKIKDCPGYTTRNSGSGTMEADGTVVIAHGLAAAPTKVVVTPTSDTGPVRHWVTSKGATSFAVTVDTTSGLNLFTFDWEAWMDAA